MDTPFEYIAIAVLVLLTGLSAGLCFTWTNAVTTGIGKLDDFSYLRSFQLMNRSIINPMFIIVFFGPTLIGIINLIAFKDASRSTIWILIAAITIYFVGVVLVTMFGNVPLNNTLDTTELSSANHLQLKNLRDLFEVKWNRLHTSRTLSAGLSFLLTIISLIQIAKSNL